MATRQQLRAGFEMTITANALSTGFYRRLEDSGAAQTYVAVAVGASSTTIIGSSNTDRNYEIESLTGILNSVITRGEDSEEDTTLTGRSEIEEFSGFASTLTTVSASQSKVISASAQSIVYGTLTITGILTISGELRIGPWPF